MAVTRQQCTRCGERLTLVKPCPYEMTESHDSKTLKLHQGDAFSLNVSSSGMLLLMPHNPRIDQVFEVYVPSTPPGKRGRS